MQATRLDHDQVSGVNGYAMDYEHLWAGDKTHGLVIVEAAILGQLNDVCAFAKRVSKGELCCAICEARKAIKRAKGIDSTLRVVKKEIKESRGCVGFD